MHKTKWWKWLFLIGILIAAAAQISQVTDEHQSSFQIESFGIIEQPDGVSCGPTSVQMVLHHYGYEFSLDEIRKVARTDWYMRNGYEIGGTTIEFVRKAMNHFGVSSKLVKGNMRGLRDYISQGRPVIVLVRSGVANSWHYVVVTGYTVDIVVVADPGTGLRGEYSNEQFERAWKFTHALWSGRSAMKQCGLCNGLGYWNRWIGPFGYCDNCAGTGQVKDHWWLLMDLAEQSNYLMVVPNTPPAG